MIELMKPISTNDGITLTLRSSKNSESINPNAKRKVKYAASEMFTQKELLTLGFAIVRARIIRHSTNLVLTISFQNGEKRLEGLLELLLGGFNTMVWGGAILRRVSKRR